MNWGAPVQRRRAVTVWKGGGRRRRVWKVAFPSPAAPFPPPLFAWPSVFPPCPPPSPGAYAPPPPPPPQQQQPPPPPVSLWGSRPGPARRAPPLGSAHAGSRGGRPPPPGCPNTRASVLAAPGALPSLLPAPPFAKPSLSVTARGGMKGVAERIALVAGAADELGGAAKRAGRRARRFVLPSATRMPASRGQDKSDGTPSPFSPQQGVGQFRVGQQEGGMCGGNAAAKL